MPTTTKQYTNNLDSLKARLVALLAHPHPPDDDVRLAGVIAQFAIAQRLEKIADIMDKGDSGYSTGWKG